MTLLHKEQPTGPRVLKTFSAPSGTGYVQPATFTLVRGDSPAFSVMTDLKRVSAATITPEKSLAEATQTMISRGVRLLLVTNREDEILGLITARDTSGERPIQLVQERGCRYSDLTVADLMCPREKIDLIDFQDVLAATVADVVATLKALHRQHALVGERDAVTGRVNIRGIFSATQIGRQLGAPIQTFDVASTFTEIENYLSKNDA
ncbi:MAG: CBS domain-containing protein [Rhodocyclaceae bacterium]|nr:CBS domain-containing protein [Rhodocyclaceae bacterium]